MKECNCNSCTCKNKEQNDLFYTMEFKNMPWYRRIWIRFVIAFFQTINML